MWVIIGAGKPFWLVNHINDRLEGFRLNSFLPHLDDIAFRIYSGTQSGSFSIYGYLTFPDKLFTRSSGADARISKEFLQLWKRRGFGFII